VVSGAHRIKGLASPNKAKGERIMKKDQVKVGGTYLAKVSDKVVPVRLDAENPHGGWDATNTATGKKVRIKSAQRLRGPAVDREHARAIAAADQQNAKARDERAKAKDGMTVGERAMAISAKAKKPADPDLVPLSQMDKANKEKKARKVSCLDAAVQILKAEGKPMNTKAMIEAMFAKKLWHSDAPTPAATLYSAILREMQAKKTDARFKKTDRGLFTVNA
jgi:hypothetical protein